MANAIVPERVEVRAITPSPADSRKLEHQRRERAAELPEVAYVVKVYLESLPEPDALGYELWLGDEQIRKYTEFKRGIYFKITQPEKLAQLRGQKVRFKRPGDPNFLESDVSVPIEAATPLPAKAMAAASPPLPTEEEVLSE